MLTHTRLSSIFVLDQDAALDFYVGVLGLEVHTDADLGFMRWLTVCVPGDRERQILLERPGAPSMDDATTAQVRDLLTKGAAGGWIGLSTDEPQALFDRLVAAGVDITDEISEKPYGIDFGIRDPFGNRLRIGQVHD
jgi:catechol 2,3-dioxygenase-like lactoylglutathione lyase family enzyme